MRRTVRLIFFIALIAAASLARPHAAAAAECAVPGGAVVEGLTAEECAAMTAEMRRTGRQLTPEAADALKSGREAGGLKPEEIRQGRELLMKRERAAAPPAEQPAGATAPAAASAPSPAPDKTGTLFGRYLSTEAPEEAPRELRPFGYDLFTGVVMPPDRALPVASDYIIGPGDEVGVTMWGRVNAQHNLTVTRDGAINFPNIGPIKVAGMTFEEMKAFVSKKAGGIVGADVSVTMGNLRSISVFVLGDVRKPGSYSVGAMSTITTALMAAGGPSHIGSLRRVELKRGKSTVAVLDLYDLFLRGDRSGDLRLHGGDVVLVPTVGAIVGVSGNVRRPAVYELNETTRLAEAIALAGGLIPTAYKQRVQVGRIEKNLKRTVVDVDASDESAIRDFVLQDGDLVRVFPIVDADVNAVTLAGNVKRPGKYELKPGMRLGDLLRGDDDLLPETHLDYGLIKRLSPPGREVALVPFNLAAIMRGGAGAENPELQPRDSVFVFSKWQFADRPTVSIEGEVRCAVKAAMERAKSPDTATAGAAVGVAEPRKADVKDDGASADRERPAEFKTCSFTLQANFTVRDLILAAGGLTKDASHDDFEVYSTDPVTKKVTLKRLNLSRAVAGGADNVLLADRDRVVVHSVFEKTPVFRVAVAGEVNRPGAYQYADNMTVRGLVFAAGGVKESAYLDEAELASRVTVDGKSAEVRYVKVNLRLALAGDPEHDLAVRNGDTLFVKAIPEWGESRYVELRGEIVFPGRYIVKKGETVGSVLERAGGFTANAYLKGAVFTRVSVRELQQKQLNEAIDRLERSYILESGKALMVAASPEEAKAQEAVAQQKKLLIEKLRGARAIGRITLRLEPLDRFSGTASDIALEGGDVITVPQVSSQVQVIGAVYNQTAFVYRPDDTVTNYLRMAGGMTKDADEDELYVLKVDGSAISKRVGSDSSWYGGFGSARLDPGDTIVVPEKIEKIAWLREAKDITQILYQIAVTAGVLIVAF